MRIAVNTISTKKIAGGAYQIAYNFLMETLKPQEGIEWYYITSSDVDEAVGMHFESQRGKRYFVFPTQPDFKGSYKRVKKELAQWEDEYKPDIIYTISSPCYFTFKTTEVMRFANAWITNPNKESWSVLPWKKWLKMRLYRIAQIRLLRKAKFIVTQSETVKNGLIKCTGLRENHIRVVPNVLPKVFSTASVNHKVKDEFVDVICAAAHSPHKNLEIIPEVLRALKEKHQITNVRFHLTITGDTQVVQRMVELSRAIGLEDNIINHGRCSQQQLCDIYNQVDFCFLPSLLETFSASSLEAMYFGLCIVATNFDFNREIMEDAGLYYKPMDAEDAADKIAMLVNNKDLCRELQEKMPGRLALFNDYGNHFKGIVDFLKQVPEIA